MAREAGKGSSRRRSEVPDHVVADNWARAFGKKNTNIENEIERHSEPTPAREFHNTWTAPEKVEEVFDPYLTINS